MSDVALIDGQNRVQNITDVLSLLKPNLTKQIRQLKKDDYILIKPNLFTTKRLLATTHLQTIEALLKFLRKLYRGRIIIAEGTSIGSTQEAFRNYGYYQLVDSYHVELLDLNHDDGVAIEVVDKNFKPMKVLIARSVAKAPFRISVTPIKTHNYVIMSLSIENMVTGSLLKGGIKPVNTAYRVLFRRHFRDYKAAIIQGISAYNFSIARIAPMVMPHLAILDGFTAMERNGPVGGQPVDLHLALAGFDPISVDALATYLVGFDPGHIGYLHYLDVNKHEIHVIGKKISECRKRIRPHDSYQEQRQWFNTKVSTTKITPS